MSLERAKLALILAFLGLNLMLAYYLYWPALGGMIKIAVTVDELKRVEEQLQKANYYLSTPIDRSRHTAAFLTVTTSGEEASALRSSITGKAVLVSEDEEGVRTYVDAGRTIKLFAHGLIKITYAPGKSLPGYSSSPTQEELVALVDQFLVHNALKPSGAQFDYMEKKENGHIALYYFYNQNNCHLFSSYLKVVMEKDLITDVELYWLEPLGWSQEREMTVITSAEALLYFLGETGPSLQAPHIISIDLGFFSQEYDAENWEVSPVWRVLTDDFKVYYVNAFTGNLESAGMPLP